MKYLNLSKGFNPYCANQFSVIDFETFTFSGGEPHIRITDGVDDDDITITHRINSFNDIGLLCVAVDALKRIGFNRNLNLFIPYFLGARQDRVCNDGESLTVKVVADIINSLGFNNVSIFDPHSDVTPALIKNCNVIKNHNFVRECLNDINKDKSMQDIYLISPDAGANKKILELSKNTYSSPIIKCDKTRDIKTGRLMGFEIYTSDLKNSDCIIVDDICDGGGTFIGLAKELKIKNCGDLYLIVSHGIFSKGFNELLKLFKTIYFTDSINTYDESLPKSLIQLPLLR